MSDTAEQRTGYFPKIKKWHGIPLLLALILVFGLNMRADSSGDEATVETEPDIKFELGNDVGDRPTWESESGESWAGEDARFIESSPSEETPKKKQPSKITYVKAPKSKGPGFDILVPMLTPPWTSHLGVADEPVYDFNEGNTIVP